LPSPDERGRASPTPTRTKHPALPTYVNPLQLRLRPAFLAHPFNALIKQCAHGLKDFDRGVTQVLRRPGAWRFKPAQERAQFSQHPNGAGWNPCAGRLTPGAGSAISFRVRHCSSPELPPAHLPGHERSEVHSWRSSAAMTHAALLPPPG